MKGHILKKLLQKCTKPSVTIDLIQHLVCGHGICVHSTSGSALGKISLLVAVYLRTCLSLCLCSEVPQQWDVLEQSFSKLKNQNMPSFSQTVLENIPQVVGTVECIVCISFSLQYLKESFIS